MVLRIDVSIKRVEGLLNWDLVGIFYSEMVEGETLSKWLEVGWSKSLDISHSFT